MSIPINNPIQKLPNFEEMEAADKAKSQANLAELKEACCLEIKITDTSSVRLEGTPNAGAYPALHYAAELENPEKKQLVAKQLNKAPDPAIQAIIEKRFGNK